MQAPAPWAFGWAQLLTLIGFLITISIAVGGFRTFGRWRKEKIEEKRIDTAIETLALVYESKFVFESIRSPGAWESEWADMPENIGSEGDRRARGQFFATFERIKAHKDFFDRAWKVQVRCTALFDPRVEETFLLMHRARREIEVSAGMLYNDPTPTVQTEDNLKTWKLLRADVWSSYAEGVNVPDRVGQRLSQFQKQIEDLCRPIIDRGYGKAPRQTALSKIADWLGM